MSEAPGYNLGLARRSRVKRNRGRESRLNAYHLKALISDNTKTLYSAMQNPYMRASGGPNYR